jgi:hypothetical protein
MTNDVKAKALTEKWPEMDSETKEFAATFTEEFANYEPSERDLRERAIERLEEEHRKGGKLVPERSETVNAWIEEGDSAISRFVVTTINAQTNMTSLYSNASKVIANASKLIHQALTNAKETPADCIKLRLMPTVPANKTLAENPLSLWAYTAGMKAALKSCQAIGK